MVSRIPSDFFGMMTTGFAYGVCGVLNEASREILVQNRVHLFGHERFHAIGARGHRGAVGWDRNFERQEGTRTSVGDVQKISANSIKLPPNWVMTSGSQVGPWKSNEISRRCFGSLCQTCRKLSRWSEFRRSSKEGGGSRSADVG